MTEQTLMTFDEWWECVYKPAMYKNPDSAEAASFLVTLEREAARQAWDAGQMVLREDFAKIVRKGELVRREREKRQG